jgi:hypothetical protein
LRLLALAVVVVALVPALVAGCSGDSSASSGDTSAVVTNIPFADGERLTYELRDDHGVIGHGTLTVARDGDQLVLKQDYEEATAPEGQKPTADHSTASVDATTLAPSSVERVVEQRDGTDTYSGAYAADGSSVTMTKDGDSKDRTIELPEHAYENESSLWLWRTLAFSEDYKSRYVSVNAVERTRQTVELEVTGQQKITVPAGTFDTWRLQVRNGRATRVAWINVDAPHQIVRWDNGSTVFLLAPDQP